jgi:hypothetical protein
MQMAQPVGRVGTGAATHLPTLPASKCCPSVFHWWNQSLANLGPPELGFAVGQAFLLLFAVVAAAEVLALHPRQ